MTRLPTAIDDAGWNALCKDEPTLSPGVAALLSRHGLAHEARRRYDSGSVPVYAVGAQHVLKLFPPTEHAHASAEARVLAAVQGRLPLPTPQLIAADTHDSWPYLLMSQLPGQRLVDAWPALSIGERDRIADALGETIATLHAIDTTALADLPPSWDGFVAEQHASATERQVKRRLDAHWLEQIPAFLDRWKPAPAAHRVLLHTEIMREHLMVDDGRLTGLFDFEPAMLGAADYEFASVGLFVACGDARTLRRVLLAYGYAPHALDEALQCRFMAHALLHRYSNLRWYLERLPAGDATTLEQLAVRWWPLH
jgi:hygromycin-B 7''-O-kinase